MAHFMYLYLYSTVRAMYSGVSFVKGRRLCSCFLLSLRFEDANPAGGARHKTAGEAVKRSKATGKSDLWWSYSPSHT